jgi:mono/diheme cytochrome c family protein
MKQMILIVLTLGLAACAPAPQNEAVSFDWQSQVGIATAGDFQTLSYQNVFENALKTNCAGCHTGTHARAGVDVTNYKSVLASSTNIAQAVQSGDMPLRGAMDPQAKDLLLRWIAAGAPEVQAN